MNRFACRIWTLKAIVSADGRKSCAAPVSGHVLHWAPAWGLNSRASLLPPCWSALLKQNFSNVNRNDIRTGVPVLSLLCSDGIFLLKRSTEGNNITSSSFIWTHYTDLAAWRALPPWKHSESNNRDNSWWSDTGREQRAQRKGFFIYTVCTCIVSTQRNVQLITYRNADMHTQANTGSKIHLYCHFPEYQVQK